MKAWGAKKAAGPDGWARSEWKQLTPEMVKPMRDMMSKMEETVKDKTMEQLMKDPVYGCSCADTEGGESDANTTGPPTDHSHVLSLQPLGRDTPHRCHQVVQNMVA